MKVSLLLVSVKVWTLGLLLSSHKHVTKEYKQFLLELLNAVPDRHETAAAPFPGPTSSEAEGVPPTIYFLLNLIYSK